MGALFSFRRLRLAVGLLVAVVGGGFALLAAVAGAAQHGPAQHGPAPQGQTATSQTPLPVRNGTARKLGAYSPSQTIRLAIGLRPPHMAAEQQFLREIQDKSSPLFHQFLTPAEWTARFAPTAASQQAVVAWAKGAGLTVTHLYPNRLVVDVAGSVGSIESALSVQINTYRLGSHTFFANDSDPVLPPR